MIDDADDQVNRLRLSYQAAYDDYQARATELVLAGDKPSQRLIDQRATALERLTAARHAYGAALARWFYGDNDRTADEGRSSERMTRIEIDILHLRCTAAFSAYQAHIMAVLERSQGGKAPSAEDLHQEEQALYEYARIRREFLDALASVRYDEPIELPGLRRRPVGPN